MLERCFDETSFSDLEAVNENLAALSNNPYSVGGSKDRIHSLERKNLRVGSEPSMNVAEQQIDDCK